MLSQVRGEEHKPAQKVIGRIEARSERTSHSKAAGSDWVCGVASADRDVVPVAGGAADILKRLIGRVGVWAWKERTEEWKGRDT